MATHIIISESEYKHEAAVQDELSHLLGEEWIILSNPPRNRTVLQIDCIILGPRGLFVVELKNWESGTVADDVNPWTINGRIPKYKNGEKKNPVVQAHNAAREFKKKFVRAKEIKVWADAISLAGPLGVYIGYTSDIVKDIVRPIQEANLLISRRIEMGAGRNKEGCKPVSKIAAISLLEYFGLTTNHDVQSWIASAYCQRPQPRPQPATPPPLSKDADDGKPKLTSKPLGLYRSDLSDEQTKHRLNNAPIVRVTRPKIPRIIVKKTQGNSDNYMPPFETNPMFQKIPSALKSRHNRLNKKLRQVEREYLMRNHDSLVRQIELEDLNYDLCVNIPSLDLSGMSISDISFIEIFDSMTDLFIDGTDIKDISPVTHCKKICYIRMCYTKIGDISNLSNMKGLIIEVESEDRATKLKDSLHPRSTVLVIW